ncbi:hypothetical protein RJ639_000297 [Escallonia herrerae]|uniref:RNA-binding protein 25 n=1 Tax=Escallonia herrerae TaxID=1293975 RepID=A0AA88X846_9ASTE|nr:hypothetical protein RJ639_000297 [Escallonia herrerae]
MADSVTTESDTNPQPDNPSSQPNQPDPSPPPPPATAPPPSNPSANPNPNPNSTTPLPPPPFLSPPQPAPIQHYGASAVPPSAPPSFRPVAPPVPLPTAPQYSPVPNFQTQGFQSTGVQPPGVAVMTSGGIGSAPVSSMLPMMSYVQPGQPPYAAMRPPYAPPMPNGYPQTGTMPPPGILRYPPPYASMLRPAFPPRPPGAPGIIPALPRPPIPGIRPIIPPILRAVGAPSFTPTEKPQTTVYVSKIAPTVENDFMLSLLQLCGPVKSWKRYQDPVSGALKSFGFCEFDSAEGVLRALRLLTKLNIDAQDLVLKVNEATTDYLKRYVEKKRENSRNLKATETEVAEKEAASASGAEKEDPLKPSAGDSKEDNEDMATKEDNDPASFGLVTEEDREADCEVLEKLSAMVEERLRSKPLPPPPPPPPQAAVDGNSNSEVPAKSRDGDSDVDVIKNDAAEERNDDETTSESKPSSEHDKPDTSSPDKRRNDRRSRDRERERDMKQREKERELEKYERDREQERARRERDREYKIREEERRYRQRVKEWEARERDKENVRKLEKEREKEKEKERKLEIILQESDGDDGYSKKRKYKTSWEDRRKRVRREREEDMADRLKEEEEIEAKRRVEEELQLQKQEENDALKLLPGSPGQATYESDKDMVTDEITESKVKTADQTSDGDSGQENHFDDGSLQNGTGDDAGMRHLSTSDAQNNSSVPTRKLGFGLFGSGKRTAVPSVFHEEEDEDAQKEKKMRPLVPIDYSTEELQAVRSTVSGGPSPDLAAAAEFAKRISHGNHKEDRPDAERDRSRRLHESQRERPRNDEESSRSRDERRKESVDRDKDRERGSDKAKTENKFFDAKQLIDTIPKTKEELFSYEINWAIYDTNGLHEKMRPWISKKIMEFLGEEETSLVDYIVSSTRQHVKASEMLERLQAILDDEAEMFVLKLWRMLIFEVRRIETGLDVKSKS